MVNMKGDISTTIYSRQESQEELSAVETFQFWFSSHKTQLFQCWIRLLRLELYVSFLLKGMSSIISSGKEK